MWPVQLAFLHFIVLFSFLYVIPLHFSHYRSSLSSPFFSSTTFHSNHKNAKFIVQCKGKACPIACQADTKLLYQHITYNWHRLWTGVGGPAPRLGTLPWGSETVPIVQEGRCVWGPVRTGTEYLAFTEKRTPDRRAHSDSLYRLSYPGRCNAAQ